MPLPKPMKFPVARLSRLTEELSALRQTLIDKATEHGITKSSLTLIALSERCRAGYVVLEDLYLFMDEAHEQLRNEFHIELDT